MGTVVTFYSYKGGVGRSFALANAAVLLSRWGYRVLCIDWDIEAPGLAHFFGNLAEESGQNWRGGTPGLVDLLQTFVRSPEQPLPWRSHVVKLVAGSGSSISLIHAGRDGDLYYSQVQSLDWGGMYEKGLGGALEAMFEELRRDFDFVLVDARTGVTDFSGIITAQLPDVLAFMFTANEQSFNGARDIARRAAKARNDLAIDRAGLLLLPVPSRFEGQVEHNIAISWRKKFASGLEEFFQPWRAREVSVDTLVRSLTIPYVPFWSFGEGLSALEDASSDAASINYSLETIAALLAHRLGNTNLLQDNRDEFVRSARLTAQSGERSSLSLFISHSKSDAPWARLMASSLTSRGLNVRLTSDSATNKLGLSPAIELSQHMVVLLGHSSQISNWQDEEIRQFQRQLHNSSEPRVLIPVVSDDVASVPWQIEQYQYLRLDQDIERVCDEIFERVHRYRLPVRGVRSRRTLTVNVSSYANMPLPGVTVSAISRNGTVLDAVSDRSGIATLEVDPDRLHAILLAHPQYYAQVVDDLRSGQNELRLVLQHRCDGGSLVVHQTGYIPGLEGRLNPILDTSGRMYLYADNIAINDGEPQPARFSLNKPFSLEDAVGNIYEATVVFIFARSTLFDYREIERPSAPDSEASP
ncbi:TIR domain-containing protein [Paraburkholderia sp. LEh10]|uniref:KGGVGR-motif variant AAA ATPase n=1 Tax=Paraburkholderia sp. LEh10 TaxID=2821353 RepID=UPI001AE67AB4|nr:TIR domain-containing protein [Paraburkholderia sp. LEh10]MBP0593612.1 TIR domain-containing protein [Paraburkholderia sp. LEh10]